MKLLVLALSLSAVLTANASDTSPISSRSVANKTHEEHRTVPLQPDKQWKISGKDYAQLLEDCGQTTNYGLATDEATEGQSKLVSKSGSKQ